jgi:cell shape-determining protein MreD
MFGTPFTVPYNEVNNEVFLKRANAWLNVLVANTIFSPVTIFVFFGLLALIWRKAWLWMLVFGLIFAGQLFINGSALDWYAGNSFGMRRMAELFPIYGFLAAVAIHTLQQRFANQQRWIHIFFAVLFIVAIGYALIFLLAFVDYIWTSPESWSGSLWPDSVLPYFWRQSNRFEVIRTIFTTHLGPPAWTQPGP